MLDKTQILDINDSEVIEFDVPEWGGSIYLRCLSGADRDWFETTLMNIKDGKADIEKASLRAAFAVRVICDSEGKLLFTKADIAKLATKSGKALDRIMERGMKLSAIDDSAEQDAKDFLSDTQTSESGTI